MPGYWRRPASWSRCWSAKSKKGQQVATSLLQAQIFMLDFQAARYLVQGEVAKQAGNNHPTSAPTGIYETDDGYINIATAGQTIWKRFCEAIEAPELAKMPEYIDGAARSKIATRLTSTSTSIWSAAPARNGSSA